VDEKLIYQKALDDNKLEEVSKTFEDSSSAPF